jgi:ABC-type transport system involved in cytochrome c biogenesis permease subunit
VDTLLVTLHVIVVVLVMGPLVFTPFVAGRAIARRDVNGARAAGKALLAFGIGSLVAAGLGALVVGVGGQYTFGTPWVIISMTIYLLVLVLALGYAVPASRRAARMIDELARPKPAGPTTSGANSTGTSDLPRLPAGVAKDAASTTPIDAGLRPKQRIDEIVGRITGSGLLMLLGVVLLVVLMVVKPFGG